MRVDVALTPALAPPALATTVVVVIDVVRAMTTVLAALQAGATGVRPVAAVEDACRLAREQGALLGGERGGLPPEGFDLGNSPGQYDRARCQGREVVLCTTNGTAVAARAAGSARVLGACLRNAGAVARTVAAQGPQDVLVLCAGTGAAVAADDVAAAGGVVAGLLAAGARPGDGALLAAAAFGAWRADLPGLLRRVASGRRLARLGLQADLDHCAALDADGLVPELCGAGVFRAAGG